MTNKYNALFIASDHPLVNIPNSDRIVKKGTNLIELIAIDISGSCPWIYQKKFI